MDTSGFPAYALSTRSLILSSIIRPPLCSEAPHDKIEDQIEVFKIIHGIEGLDSGMFFKYRTDNRTRGHTLTSTNIRLKYCTLQFDIKTNESITGC